MNEEELYELKEKIYESDDPTSFSDYELAELWRHEWRQLKKARHGEMQYTERAYQASVVINNLEELQKDLGKVAKTKLNAHKTRVLRMIDKLSSLSEQYKILYNDYLKETGLFRKRLHELRKGLQA